MMYGGAPAWLFSRRGKAPTMSRAQQDSTNPDLCRSVLQVVLANLHLHKVAQGRKGRQFPPPKCSDSRWCKGMADFVGACPALGDAGNCTLDCLSGLNAYGEMRNLRSEATLITKHKVSLGWTHIWFAKSLVAESMANKQTNKLVMAVRIADRGHPTSIVRMTCR